MHSSLCNNHPLFKVINHSLIDLPSSNLLVWWHFGSLLGLCLGIQIATGLFLSIHYVGHIDLTFSSVAHISRDVEYGWLIWIIHANGASMFFICIYLHISLGIYYNSYNNYYTWHIGVLLLFLTMAVNFTYSNNSVMRSFVFYPFNQVMFWFLLVYSLSWLELVDVLLSYHFHELDKFFLLYILHIFW